MRKTGADISYLLAALRYYTAEAAADVRSNSRIKANMLEREHAALFADLMKTG